MCLYHISICPSPSSKVLHKIFFGSGYGRYRYNTIRCWWWTDSGNDNDALIQHQLCPYMIVRHGDLKWGEERELVCLAQDEGGNKRGCPRCWKKICAEKWPDTRFADRVEGLEDTEDSEAHNMSGHLESDEEEEEEEQDSSDHAERTDFEDSDDGSISDDVSESGENTDEEDNVDEVEMQNHLNEKAHSINRFSNASASFVVMSHADDQSRSTQQIRSGSVLLRPTQRIPAKPDVTTDLLQRRREEIGLAMPLKMSLAHHNTPNGKQPSKCPLSPGKMNTAPTSSTPKVKLNVTSSSAEPKKECLSSTKSQLNQLTESVSDAFRRLQDAIVAGSTAVVGQSLGGDEDGENEVLNAIEDGSFEDALVTLFEENTINVTSKTLSISPRSKEASALISTSTPNVLKRPHKDLDSTHEETELLRTNVKRLRGEKAALTNRVATLLQEKAAAMAREAELLQRLNELDADTTKDVVSH